MINIKTMKTKEEILEFVLSAGSDSTEVFGGRFKGGYELQQCPEEITDFLEKYQGLDISNFLEIGVAAGGNTRIFTDFLKIKDVYVMDLNIHPSISYDGNPNARDNNFTHLKNYGELKSFFGDSHSEDAKKWLESLNIKFQMVFIDGDHTEEGVTRDFFLYKHLVKENGWIGFHDIKNSEFHHSHNCFVDRLWNKLSGDKIEFIDSTTGFGGIGFIQYNNNIKYSDII